MYTYTHGFLQVLCETIPGSDFTIFFCEVHLNIETTTVNSEINAMFLLLRRVRQGYGRSGLDSRFEIFCVN